MMQRLILISLIAFVCLGLTFCSHDYHFPFTTHLKEDFSQKFTNICMKYSFVDAYKQLLNNPNPKKFIIFIFHDEKETGGLGDRFSGLITAFSMALAYQRMLIIIDHSGLNRFFSPYHFAVTSDPSSKKADGTTDTAANSTTSADSPQSTAQETKQKSIFFEAIQDWIPEPLPNDWLQDGNQVKGLACLNDVSQACSLDISDLPNKFIVYRSNRSFLCRYCKVPLFQRILGIDADSDLYEAAGCILRLVLWPHDNLWKLIDQHYYHAFKEIEGFYSKDKPFQQIAIHYRCGDMHYRNNSRQTQCNVENALPTELATCASNHLLRQVPSDASTDTSGHLNVSRIIFITSDHKPATHEIVQHLQATIQKTESHVYVAPTGCHVDVLNHDKAYAHECLHTTIVPWFMLALSQTYFTQTNEFKHPFSGYSRSAGMYSLLTDPFFLGRQCDRVHSVNASKFWGMSWIC